jgi:hypothetical protein
MYEMQKEMLFKISYGDPGMKPIGMILELENHLQQDINVI